MSRRVFVVPGDELGVAEEYLPMLNAYVDRWIVRARVVGIAEADPLKHEVRVRCAKEASVPREGDVVYAVAAYVRDVVCYLDVFYNESRDKIYAPPYRGSLHISEVSTSRVRSLYDILGYGDVVRARVISDKPPFSLSIKGFEYGVVFARCPLCLKPLKKRGLWLYCRNCRKVFKRRKISKLYLVR